MIRLTCCFRIFRASFCQDRASAGSSASGTDSERDLRRTIHGKSRMEKPYKRPAERNPPIQAGGSFRRQCHVFSVPDRPCTAKKTYSCPYSNRKRRPEASGANPIWFIKSVKRSRYIYTAYSYRKKAYLCAKKNLKWKGRD